MNQREDCPGIYLSIDHRTQLVIAVNLRDATAELRCSGLEMKMREHVLGRLIEVCEQARLEVGATSNNIGDGQTVATRVECDSEIPLTWSKVGDLVELSLGTIVIRATGPALVALTRGARMAHSGLKQHLASARGHPAEPSTDEQPGASQ